jgi:hypothetical protein
MFKVCPSYQQIRTRCAREKWKKTLYQDRVDAAQERSYRELFEEAGLGNKETVQLIKEGIIQHERIVERLVKSLNEGIEKIPDGKGGETAKIQLSIDTLDMLKDFFTSLKVRNIYLRERNRLTGDYAAVKIRETKPSQGRTDEDMSLDELLSERERLQGLLKQ